LYTDQEQLVKILQELNVVEELGLKDNKNSSVDSDRNGIEGGQMAYGTFKTVSEVARKFNIEVVDPRFVQEQKIEVPEIYFVDIAKKLDTSINFINEYTICEAILRPILEIVTVRYENLDIWSHVAYRK